MGARGETPVFAYAKKVLTWGQGSIFYGWTVVSWVTFKHFGKNFYRLQECFHF